LTSPVLQTVALACERDLRLLFENLELRLASGDMVQISGPNGSGKTSLLRLLAGLMQPTDGQVLLNGQPLTEQAQRTGAQPAVDRPRRRDQGPADPGREPVLALRPASPAAREAIWQALAAVGLRGFEDVPCHTLSAGQQRRVALARLYLDSPPLWILDEPFTALDKQGVAQLEEHLAGHCERGGWWC
jgi:heme exporter protein A